MFVPYQSNRPLRFTRNTEPHLNGPPSKQVGTKASSKNLLQGLRSSSRSQQWRNYQTNNSLIRPRQATQPAAALVNSPPRSPPPSLPLPDIPHDARAARSYNGLRFGGGWPVAWNTNFAISVPLADFAREPRRAPLPPQRPLHPPSGFSILPLSSINPVFQNKDHGGCRPVSKIVGATSIQNAGTTSHHESRESLRKFVIQGTNAAKHRVQTPSNQLLKGRDRTILNSRSQASTSTRPSYIRSINRLTRSRSAPPCLNRVERRLLAQAGTEKSTSFRIDHHDRIVEDSSIEASNDTSSKIVTSTMICCASSLVEATSPNGAVGSLVKSSPLSVAASDEWEQRPTYESLKQYRLDTAPSSDRHELPFPHPRRSPSISPTRAELASHDGEHPDASQVSSLNASTRHTASYLAADDGQVANGRVCFQPVVNSSRTTPPGVRTPAHASDPPTPVATQAMDRTSSTATVVPPEWTAWQSATYVQGPIKLLKPAIVPRKDSLATLDPFQEAVDQLYQRALLVARRDSDNTAEHDICAFFHDFGFDQVGFTNDELDNRLRRTGEHGGMGVSRPATQPPPNPMERRVAQESVACMRGLRISPALVPSAVRGDGLPSISTPGVRRESSTLGGRSRSVVEMLSPLPEASMLDFGQATSRTIGMNESESFVTGSSGFDWDDDDVREIEAAATWMVPVTAAMPKHRPSNRSVSSKRTRNPVAKLRRLVATASTLL